MTKIKIKPGDVIKLVIDEKTLKDYNNFYFEKYPKRRVPPISKPTHPSVNTWFILKRPQLNALKQKWKNFIVWFVESQGLSELNIQNCTMECISYLKTKIRADCDNMCPKFLIDGLVEARFVVDDDYKHIHSLTLKIGYDKFRPRTEILITIL